MSVEQPVDCNPRAVQGVPYWSSIVITDNHQQHYNQSEHQSGG
jgi:hypothetical protein